MTGGNTMIALPSTYCGVRFRSRLEARWAVLFESMPDLTWEYEPEGFCMEGECYLPDFRITDRQDAYFVEVKPAFGDFTKAKKLSILTDHPVLFCEGPPSMSWWPCWTGGREGCADRWTFRDSQECQVWFQHASEDPFPHSDDSRLAMAVSSALSYRWGR